MGEGIGVGGRKEEEGRGVGGRSRRGRGGEKDIRSRKIRKRGRKIRSKKNIREEYQEV